MSTSKIEWTEHSWNPIRGCSRISPGCQNCYAERMAARFSGDTSTTGTVKPGPFWGFAKRTISGEPAWTGKVELIPEMLDIPLKRKKPTTYFVNSMSDLFHEDLPDEAIYRMFAVMMACPQHTFQILTKRAKNMRRVMTEMYGRVAAHIGTWPLPHVWLGASVENQQYAVERIPGLLLTPAAVHFVSYEPALGPVDFRPYLGGRIPPELPVEQQAAMWGRRGIGWVIVGGESGPGARPFDIQWARNTIAQCKTAGVACFVKQIGAYPVSTDQGLSSRQAETGWSMDVLGEWLPDINRRRLYLNNRKGGNMSEWPADLRVREMPEDKDAL